jgi:hypothetical protein
MQSWCEKLMSPANSPRPTTSGGSSSRSTDWPIQFLFLPREAGEGDRPKGGGGGAELTASPLPVERLLRQLRRYHDLNRRLECALPLCCVVSTKHRGVHRVVAGRPWCGLCHRSRSQGVLLRRRSREHTARLDADGERQVGQATVCAIASRVGALVAKGCGEGVLRFQRFSKVLS